MDADVDVGGVVHNGAVGRHTDQDAAELEPARAPLPRRRVLALTLGVIATLAAWGVLVWAAIDFGRQGRAGAGTAWVFAGIAAVGAAVALFTMLLLGARLLSVLRRREQSPARPARAPGGHRATRRAS